MEFSQPIFTDEQIADADWSDAGFFGFLESLSDRDAPAEKKLCRGGGEDTAVQQSGWPGVQQVLHTPRVPGYPHGLQHGNSWAGTSTVAPQMTMATPDLMSPLPMQAGLQNQNPEQDSDRISYGGAPSMQNSGSSGELQAQRLHAHGQDGGGALRRKSSNSGDEGGSGKGMRVHKSAPDRDKNRAAQKAFRQRKKEQERAKEALVEELSAKLEAVQLEKARLELQNSLLQNALVERVKLAGEASSAEKKAVTGRVIRTGQGWKTNLEWGPCDVILLEKGMQLRVTKQTLQEMQLPAVAKLWKSYVNKIATCLPGAWRDEQGEDGLQVQVLLAEALSVVAYMARNIPQLICEFASSRLEDNPLAPLTPTFTLWKSILKKIRLSEEQRTELLRRRRLFFTQIGSLVDERRRIHAHIKEIDGGPDHRRSMAALRYCQLQEATKQLHSNVQALQDNKCIFFCGCWREVLRPVQAANMVVQAFPFHPDLLAVLSCLAEEAGEPTAMDILRSATLSDAQLTASPTLEGMKGAPMEVANV